MTNIFNFLNSGTLARDIFPILYWILAVAAIAGVVYAVWLGLMLGTASDDQKRAKAKKRIINVAVSIFAIIVLVMILLAVEPDSTTPDDDEANGYSISIEHDA